jgi:uncharacterized DUF497 family protein
VKFTWDQAAQNLKAHGVDFRLAATVFDDTLSTTFPDVDDSVGERRFLIIGMSALANLGGVAHRVRRYYSNHQCEVGHAP